MRILSTAAALLCSLSALPNSAMAWNDDGHRIVALIADHYLLPPARTKVQALLKADTDTATAHDIASEATWADKIRDKDPARTGAWHFLDMPAGRPDIPGACDAHPPLPAGTSASEGPAKACIIDKINQFAAELANTRTSAAEQLLALKYLLNLVGDIHQPLRTADEYNRHGASLAVSAPMMTPGNLFDFWESNTVSRLEGRASPTEAAHLLITRISEADAKAWGSRAPQLWALESYQLGVDLAYGMTGGYDDEGRSVLHDREIDLAIQTTALQLSRAGVRLAYVINEAFAPKALVEATTVRISEGNATVGKLFAQGPCAVCHNVAPGQSNNTTMAPDFAAIAKTSGVTDVALDEFLTGPHPSMPNIHLTQKQKDDLITYIMSLR